MDGYRRAFDTAVENDIETAVALTRLVANVPQVQAAIKAVDRTSLTEMFALGFNELKALSGVDQFQFHTSPATSFLRIHMPGKFGDDLSSFRKTVVEANRDSRLVAGLESGVGGLDIRAVLPVPGAKGSVEFGLSLGQPFAESFKKQYGIDVTILVPEEKGGFKVLAATSKEAKLDEGKWAEALAGKAVFGNAEIRGQSFAVQAVPVRDYSGKPVVVVELAMDNSEYIAQYREGRTKAVLLSLVVTAVGLLITWVLAAGIANPLEAMAQVMRQIADGKLDVLVPFIHRQDEVGTMARAVQVFKDRSADNRRLEGEQEKLRSQAEAQRHEANLAMATDFESHVNAVVEHVASAATEMDATSQSLATMAEQTSSQSKAAAQAADRASANVQTVASAAEELSQSIGQIGQEANQASEIARLGVVKAAETNEIVKSLSEATAKIDDVVGLISSIASQTNLLALNATIEAARAGDAGKGFAVVANEVKHLASQTGKATGEIAEQIGAVQQVTRQAVAAIEEIATAIGDISKVSVSISSAVQEQRVATLEIARNVEAAVAGTSDVAMNIAGVTEAAEEAGRAAILVMQEAHQLSKTSEELHREVDEFLCRVRQA